MDEALARESIEDERMVVIKKPKTAEELTCYYDLRYRILRKPWNQPKGSEKDERENVSVHVMAMDGDTVVGVGRLHLNTDDESQVRYMGVDDGHQGKGIGGKILKKLEMEAVRMKAKSIVLDARQDSVPFYKKHGYKVMGLSHTLFEKIAHLRMKKEL